MRLAKRLEMPAPRRGEIAFVKMQHRVGVAGVPHAPAKLGAHDRRQLQFENAPQSRGVTDEPLLGPGRRPGRVFVIDDRRSIQKADFISGGKSDRQVSAFERLRHSREDLRPDRFAAAKPRARQQPVLREDGAQRVAYDRCRVAKMQAIFARCPLETVGDDGVEVGPLFERLHAQGERSRKQEVVVVELCEPFCLHHFSSGEERRRQIRFVQDRDAHAGVGAARGDEFRIGLGPVDDNQRNDADVLLRQDAVEGAADERVSFTQRARR